MAVIAERSLGFSVTAMDRASSTFAKVAAAANELGRELRGLDKTNVSIDADISRVQAAVKQTEQRISELKKRVEGDTPQLDLDIAEAEAKERKLRGDLDELRKQKVTPEVELKIAEAEAQLGRLGSKLEELRAKKVTPEVHAEIAKSEADLVRFNARLVELDAKRINIPVDVDTAKAHGKIETLDKSFGAATIRIAALGRAMGALSMPAGIVAALPAVASLGASAVTTAGALWLLPAAALAGAGAAATLGVGFAHVSDALGPTGTPAQIKKVNEALAALSPQARATVETIRGLGPAWSSVRLDVQERLFAGMAATVGNLASIYLPILKTGLGGIATELNRSATGLATWAAKGRVVADMGTIFEGVRATMAQLAPVATSVASMFTNIGVVGMQFLPGLASGFAGAAASAAAFVARARESGQLAVWIKNALTELQLLGSIAMNVGGILGGIFSASRQSGESFLSVLDRVTERLKTAVQSPEGAAALQSFFTTTSQLVGLFVDKVVQAWPAIAAGAGAFAALLVAAAPLSNTIFGLVATGLVPLLNAVQFMAPVLGPAIVLFGLWRAGTMAVTAALVAYRTATAVATAVSVGYQLAMGTNLVLTNAQAAAVSRYAVAAKLGAAASAVVTGAQWLLNAALAANPIGLVVIAIAALVAGFVYAYKNSETFRNIVTGALNAVGTAVSAVVDFFSDLPGNIGGILSSLGSMIASGASAAWGWLTTAASNAVSATLSFLAGLPGQIARALGFLAGALVSAAVAAWNGFVWASTTGVSNVITFVASLPGRILSALASLAAWLVTAAVTAWNGFVTGTVTGIAAVVSFVVTLPQRIASGLASLASSLAVTAVTAWQGFVSGTTAGIAAVIAFVVTLPSKITAALAGAAVWLVQTGHDILTGLIGGLTSGVAAVYTFFADLVSNFLAGFKEGLGIASPSTVFAQFGMDILQGLINGLQALFGGLLTIVQTIWQGLVTAFQAGIDVLSSVWSGFWGALQSAASAAWSFIATAVQAGWALVSGAFGAAIGFVAGIWNGFWSSLQLAATIAWSLITAAVQAGWSLVTGAFSAAVAFVGGIWTAFWTGLQVVVGAVWGAIQAAVTFGWSLISGAFSAAVALVAGIWSAFWTGLQVVAGVVWAAIQLVVSTGWSLVTGAFNAAVAFLTGIWSGFWNGLTLVATTVWNAIVAFFTAAFAAYQAMFTGVWNAISAVFTTVWNFILTTATTIWNAIVAYFTASFAMYQAMFAAVWNAVSSVFTTVWNFIRNTAITVWNAISAFFTAAFAAYQAMFTAAWTLVQTVFTTVWNFIRTTAVTIWTAISAFFTAAFATFQAFFTAVWTAVQTVFTTVWTFIQNTAITIWNAISAFFTAAFAAFQAFFAGVWNTISAFFVGIWNGLRDTAVNAWNGIRAFFGTVFSEFSGFFASTWNGIVATFDRIWSGITTIATRVWGAVRGAFVGGVNAIIDVINTFAGAINKVAGMLGFNINLGIPRLGDGGPVVAAPRTATSTAAGLRDGGPIHYRQVIHRARGGNTSLRRGGKLPYTGANRDTLPAMAGRQPYALMGEEYVVRRSSARALGSSDLNAINNADRRPVDIVPRSSGGPAVGRASGGPIEVDEKVAKRHGPFLAALADRQAEAVQAAQVYGGPQQMIDALNSGRSKAEQTVGRSRQTMPGYRKQGLAAINRDLGGAIAFAKSMSGKPYIWGGTTTAGTDCSGYQGMITRVLRNQAPARIGSTADFPWPGFRPGLNSQYGVGAFKGNPGHMAGTLAGVNVESGGSPSRVKYGAGAVGADSGQFTTKASLPEVGGVFASGGGGGFFQALIRPIVEALLKPLRDRITPVRDNVGEGYGKRMVAGVGVKLIDFLIEKAGAADAAGGGAGGAAGPAGTGPVADQVRAVAARYGWGEGAEWAAIDWIIGKESGWDPNAKNPNSSAAGLFQMIDSTAAAYGGRSSNPGQQADAGMRYIKDRYGTPTAAKRFWEANGHYDRGGMARGRGVMFKDVLTPERVLNGRQTANHERLTGVLDSGGGQRLLSVLERTAAANPALDRAQRVQRGAVGAAVTVDTTAVAATMAGLRSEVAALQKSIRDQRPVNVYARTDDPTEVGRQTALQLRL